MVGHENCVLKQPTYAKLGKLVISSNCSTASGEPMWTIWNSVFNLLWTASSIMAWEFDKTGQIKDPFRLFSKKTAGKDGPVSWGEITQVFQGDDTVALYQDTMSDYYDWLIM